MKKVSTVEAEQENLPTEVNRWVGSGRSQHLVLLDEVGQIQLEQRVRTTAKALQEVFGAMHTTTS